MCWTTKVLDKSNPNHCFGSLDETNFGLDVDSDGNVNKLMGPFPGHDGQFPIGVSEDVIIRDTLINGQPSFLQYMPAPLSVDENRDDVIFTGQWLR